MKYKCDLDELIDEFVGIVKMLRSGFKLTILPNTALLSGECDLDSLEMLELVETLNATYGVDFMDNEHSIADLSSPSTIASAIVKSHELRSRAASQSLSESDKHR